MKLTRKLNVLLVLVLICAVLMLSSTYAWLTLALRPEINSIDTNIGANGSLEIALLTEQSFADLLQIHASMGDSAAQKDAAESNTTWGNVIELSDARYGLEEIVLLPARLNVSRSADAYHVSKNLLKIADFGIDGRVTILSEETVSAVYGESKFTYYVDRQTYGVRAIGTISNLTIQQTALAQARSNVKAYTAAAARSVKHSWRDNGGGVMDIFARRYSENVDSFTETEVASIRNMAIGLLEALDYVDSALRQGIIGMAASQITDEADFENLCTTVSNTAVPLSGIVASVGSQVSGDFADWAAQVDIWKNQLQLVVVNSYALSAGGSWEEIKPMLDVILDGERANLGEKRLSDPSTYDSLAEVQTLTLRSDSGIMAGISAYAGNYSAFCRWKDSVSVEARTADPNEISNLLRLEWILAECKAASGGWTRANMDDLYGFAVDLGFRCNAESDLLLQTVPAMRTEETSEFPVTQGSGSYMRFTSENMDTPQLLQLMDGIRIGFLSDRGELLCVAKLNVSNYEEQEEGIFAPLYLYEYKLEEDGSLSIGERRSEDAKILHLSQNSPEAVTVIVWLDGDYINNSMVSASLNQSMSGVLNLQFSSSADLRPSHQIIDD